MAILRSGNLELPGHQTFESIQGLSTLGAFHFDYQLGPRLGHQADQLPHTLGISTSLSTGEADVTGESSGHLAKKGSGRK
jgi:hypothetical protein